MQVNQYLFYALCVLAIPGILLIISMIAIMIWPKSDDKKFLEKENLKKLHNDGRA